MSFFWVEELEPAKVFKALYSKELATVLFRVPFSSVLVLCMSAIAFDLYTILEALPTCIRS